MADGKGWVDIHGHFLMPMSDSEAHKNWENMKEACFMAPEPYIWDENAILKYLDRANISMQMLSYLPKNLEALKKANDFGASVVKRHPTRFGLLAALPTNDPDACLTEISRAQHELEADGFAVTCVYQGVSLSDASLAPVMAELNRINAVVFMHPDAYGPATQGRPAPLIEVAFETTRTLVDMLYTGIFRQYPNITFIVAHCGAALPLLADRLELLGTEPWVPNPNKITKDEVKQQLSKLYLDTAAVGLAPLGPALRLVGKEHIVYGADCGVPCSTETTMEENRQNILNYDALSKVEIEAIGHNVKVLFPRATKRMGMAHQHS